MLQDKKLYEAMLALKHIQNQDEAKKLFASQSESNGEDVFGEMLDDLLAMSALLDEMYGNMELVYQNFFHCQNVMLQSKEILKSSDRILSKWEMYADHEV